MIIWLHEKFKSIRNQILYLYVFGSFLDLNVYANDIDLVVVTKSRAGEQAWEKTRDFCKLIEPDFFEAFGKSLSIIIVTPREWSEIDGVIVTEHRIRV